jgi:two-component system response regulator NreC
MPIKVLVADDSAIVRQEIVRLLRGDSGIEVVGESETFAQTLEAVATNRPVVVVLDLFMPDERDFVPQFISMQLQKYAPCIVAVSMAVDEEAKQRASALGAKVLLDKLNLVAELVPAIRRLSGLSPRHQV